MNDAVVSVAHGEVHTIVTVAPAAVTPVIVGAGGKRITLKVPLVPVESLLVVAMEL